MRKILKRSINLLAFFAGIITALLLMALLPVAFQPVATSQSQENRVAINSGTYQVLIHGYVPTICRVSVESQFSGFSGSKNNISDLGKMSEFCNSENGYIIYVDHTPKLTGAIIKIDGRNFILETNGSTAILQSSRPARNSHTLSLDLSNVPNATGSLWFRIVPL